MKIFKGIVKKQEESKNPKEKVQMTDKKKLENMIALIIILIITIIVINSILKVENKTESQDEKSESNGKVLSNFQTTIDDNSENTENAKDSSDLENSLEEILKTIKGVGKVNVFVNYSESSKVVAMYNEKTTASEVEETDSAGGVRNTTSTETQKDVIFSENGTSQTPVTEKVIMPTIEGAIVTAEGASNSKVKSDIVNAVQAVTGLSIEKIQVFEME